MCIHTDDFEFHDVYTFSFLSFIDSEGGTDTSETNKEGDDGYDSDSDSSDSDDEDDNTASEEGREKAKKKQKKVLTEEEKKRIQRMKKEKVFFLKTLVKSINSKFQSLTFARLLLSYQYGFGINSAL